MLLVASLLLVRPGAPSSVLAPQRMPTKSNQAQRYIACLTGPSVDFLKLDSAEDLSETLGRQVRPSGHQTLNVAFVKPIIEKAPSSVLALSNKARSP